MKNMFIKLLALTLVLAFSLSFVACFAPKPLKDLDDAAENLEDEDYMVTYDDKCKDMAGIEEYLSAYSEDYEDSLTVIIFEKSSTAKLYYKMTKESQKDGVKSTKSYLKYLEHLVDHYDGDMDSAEEDSYDDDNV